MIKRMKINDNYIQLKCVRHTHHLMCHQELWTGQLVLQEESIGYCTMHIVMFQYSPDGNVGICNIVMGLVVLLATSEMAYTGQWYSDTHYHTHHMWTAAHHRAAVLMNCLRFLFLDFPQTSGMSC